MFEFQDDLKGDSFKFLATNDAFENMDSDGVVLTLKFEVKEQARGNSYQIDLNPLQIIRMDGTEQTAQAVSATIVVDTSLPIITGIVDGKTYCEQVTFTVNESNIQSVAVNGNEAKLNWKNQYTLLPADEPQTVEVVDKVGNRTSITVTVNAEHQFGENGYCVHCGVHQSDASDTGDHSNALPLILLCLLSASGVTLLFITHKKQKLTVKQ